MIAKYKQNRKLITIKCDICGLDYEKPTTEYNRNQNLGRKSYCSRSCTGKSTTERLKTYPKFNLTPYSNNKIDEYTPFRYYMKNVRKRFKESNIEFEDLKNQWSKQKGLCAYSGVKLELSTHSKIGSDPIYTASLDRIDSSKGYIVDNIQFVSQSINYMKNTMSHENTLKLCHIIANYYKI